MIPLYLPFTLRRTVAGEDCQCTVRCHVRSVDARMLNSRKLSVRVGLCLALEVYEPQAEVCCRPTTRERRLQMKCADYPMQLPVECGEKNLLLRDTVALGAGQPAAARLLHTAGRCEIVEEKLTGSKAVCKGSLQLSVLYETPEGSLAATQLSLPFSQFMDLRGSYEEQGLHLMPVLTSLEASVEGEGIGVEAGICMQLCVTQTVPVPLVEDAYATRGTLELQWREYGMRPRLDHRLLHQELRQELPAQAVQVVRAEALPDVAQAEWQAEHCRVVVPVQLRVLYLDAEGQYQCVSHRAELQAEVPAANRRCRVWAWVDGALFAAPGAGGIEVRLPMAICCDWYSDAELRSICGGTLADGHPREDDPAVIIRTMEGDVPLWDIAKELHTTVSAIQLANDMEDDVAPAGTMLLIPIVA